MHKCYAMQILETMKKKKNNNNNNKKMVTKNREKKHKESSLLQPKLLDATIALELLFILECWATPGLE